jgi:hypothetical protein
VALLLTLFAASAYFTEGAVALAVTLCLLGLLLPAAAMLVSGWAWRQVETQPLTGGRALALSGIAAGLVGALWSVTAGAVILARSLVH